MNGCLCSAAYIGAERMCLRAAIAENKSALSEVYGYDVDDRVATQDFLDHLIEAFGRHFRINFCRACPFAAQCEARLCPQLY